MLISKFYFINFILLSSLMVVIFVSAEILDVNFYMALIGFFIMC